MKHTFRDVGIAGVGHTPLEGAGFRLVDNVEFIRRLTAPAHTQLFGTTLPSEEQIAEIATKWRDERPGITTRCITNLTTLDMAEIAATEALRHAGISPQVLGAIVFTSNTADRVFPKNSCALIDRLGASSNCIGIDMSGSCADGGLALVVGASLTAACSTVLVVASERATRIVERGNWLGGNLFGDAAGAVVLQSADNGECGLRVFTEDSPFGGNWDLISQDLKFDYDGRYNPAWSDRELRVGPFRQEGAKVHEWAGSSVVASAEEFIQSLLIPAGQIKLIIPHQASTTTLNLLEKKLTRRLPDVAGKFFRHVSRRGNTSSASTLVSLSEAVAEQRLVKGDWFVGLTFGAGLQKAFYATRL